MPRKIPGVRKTVIKRKQILADGSTRTTPYTYFVADLNLGLDATGKRKRRLIYCATQAEALEAVRDNLVKHPPKKAPVGKSQTLAAYLANWVIAVRDDVEETTHRSYSQTIELHVLPYLDEVELADVDGDSIRKLYAAIRRAGTSASMCKRIHTILRIALNAAVMERAIPSSPLVTVKAPKHNSRPIESLTESQARDFLAAVKGHRLEGLFVLALTCGMREGELFATRWQDVDILNQTIQVRQSLREVNGKLDIAKPKGGKVRSIEIGALATAAMERRLALAKREGHNSEYCFPSPRGQWLRKSNFLRSAYAPLREKAGLPTTVRFHDLRHSAASLALRTGVVDTKTLQEQLGHADVATTLRIYAHTSPALHRAAARAMDELLAPR